MEGELGRANMDASRLQQFAIGQLTEGRTGESSALTSTNRNSPFHLIPRFLQVSESPVTVKSVGFGEPVLSPFNRDGWSLEANRDVPGAKGLQVSPLILQSWGQIGQPLLFRDFEGSRSGGQGEGRKVVAHLTAEG